MRKKRIFIILIELLFIIVGLFVLFKFIFSKKTNDNLNNELIGLWDVDGNTKYQFDSKGNGKIIVPMSEYEFTYEIKDNVISIDFKNETSIDTKYEFELSENNLELKDLNQSDVNLKLKKVN